MNRSTTEKILTRITVFTFFLMLFASCGSSRRTVGVEEGWEILDDRKVNFVRDKDVIEVKSRNQFTAIQFKVEDRDIRINELQIYFDNGDKLEPAIDDVVKAGESSRIIDIGREGRFIDRIEFKYRTTGSILKGRAQVLTLGRRYNPYGY
jgi:hypothetical protein